MSLVCIYEEKLLKDIEKLLKKPIEAMTLAGFEPDPTVKAEPIQLRSEGHRPSGRNRSTTNPGKPRKPTEQKGQKSTHTPRTNAHHGARKQEQGQSKMRSRPQAPTSR